MLNTHETNKNMRKNVEETKEKIYKVIKENPEGLTIQEIAKKAEC